MTHSTRRQFLHTAAAAGAAAAIGPTLLHAADKAGTKKPVVGSGAHTYEVHHDWGELPAGLKYGNTHGVVEDAQGQIYVHHTVNAASESHDSMEVYDKHGKFVRSWGKDFKGGAHGLHIRKEGREEFLYLADTARGIVVKTNLKGEEVYTIGYPKESEKYQGAGADGKPIKYSPTNVAIAPNGDVYVGDGYGSSFINQYDSKGKFIRTFGGAGKEPGQTACPHGLIVDLRGGAANPVLLVADRNNRRLQTFTLDGKHVAFIDGTTHPCHFSEHKGVMVVPDLWARVTLLDRDNKVITHLGDAGPESWQAIRKGTRDQFPVGKFVCPHGACFDHDGNIFVAEWVEIGRVTKLRKV